MAGSFVTQRASRLCVKCPKNTLEPEVMNDGSSYHN